MAGTIALRPRELSDHAWVTETLTRHWGWVCVARKGELLDAFSLPGLVGEVDGTPCGVALFAVRGDDLEVASRSTELEGVGLGRALLPSTGVAWRRHGP